MLSRVQIKDWESISEADITLGKITVIIGQSNLGKSSILRSIDALSKGIHKSSVIRHKQTQAVVTAYVDEWKIDLIRKKTTTDFVLTNTKTGEVLPLPKSARKVPDKILEILQVDDSQYAEQFEPPFLLKDTGPEIARKLGELTNAIVIFEAAGEGLRVRKAKSGELKVRESDLVKVTESIQEFEDLPGKVQLLQEVEDNVHLVQEYSNTIATLTECISEVERCYTVIQQIPTYTELPDSVDIDELHNECVLLESLIDIYYDNLEIITKCSVDVESIDQEIVKLHEEIHDLLIEEGTCPTCNQTIDFGGR